MTLEPAARVMEAAVLVPLVSRAEGIQVLLTQRTAHLDDHAGQICFPGGRAEPGDASREETALRETEEEIGLARGAIVPLGRLPDHEMPSGFRITPVVGWIEPPFSLTLDPFEVAGAFEVPLAHFLDVRNYQRREYDFRGRHRHYLADSVRRTLHLGRDGGHALQPVPRAHAGKCGVRGPKAGGINRTRRMV